MANLLYITEPLQSVDYYQKLVILAKKKEPECGAKECKICGGVRSQVVNELTDLLKKAKEIS